MYFMKKIFLAYVVLFTLKEDKKIANDKLCHGK